MRRDYSVKQGAHGPVGFVDASNGAPTNAKKIDGGTVCLDDMHAKVYMKIYPGLLTLVVPEPVVVAEVEDEIVPVDDAEPESEPKIEEAEPKKTPAKRVTRKRRSRKATAKKA